MSIRELRELRRLLTRYELEEISPEEYKDELIIITKANKLIHDDIRYREENTINSFSDGPELFKEVEDD